VTALPAERSPFLEWSAASVALPGEAHSGDVHVVRTTETGVVVAVLDGLGHGADAATAARRAAGALETNGSLSVIALVRRCHEALIGTRGVAMCVAAFDAEEDTMSWCSVGNVEGVLMRADPGAVPRREAVLMRSGVVGLELPLLRASVTTVAPGDLLVLATDGIRPEFVERLHLPTSLQRLAQQILRDYARGTDDALVLVARYLGRAAHQT
jgi:serine phosphatase RsbU (regulator of sigma subunit)